MQSNKSHLKGVFYLKKALLTLLFCLCLTGCSAKESAEAETELTTMPISVSATQFEVETTTLPETTTQKETTTEATTTTETTTVTTVPTETVPPVTNVHTYPSTEPSIVTSIVYITFPQTQTTPSTTKTTETEFIISTEPFETWKDEEPEIITSAPATQTTPPQTTETSTTTTAPQVDKSKENLTPDVDANYTDDVCLSEVKIGDTTVDISFITAVELLHTTGMEQNLFFCEVADAEEFYFEGYVYGTECYSNLPAGDFFRYTDMLSIELVDEKGELITGDEIPFFSFVKAVRTTRHTSQNQNISFYQGIRAGMTEDEFKQITEMSFIPSDTIYYANQSHILYIEFANGYVDAVTLFNRYI